MLSVAGRQPPAFDVIILAGGRGTRLGGADKPGLVVGSATMAATAARAAAAARARQIILVGPDRPDVAAAVGPAAGGGAARGEWWPALIVTREDPPGGGPVPALRAGLARAAAPWVAVLAADLPFLSADRLLGLLAAGAAVAAAGAVVMDESGAAQWLAGCWRTERLGSALAAYQGASLRGLLGPLRPVLVRDDGPPDGPSPWLDCDTPADLAAARDWLAARAAGSSRAGPGLAAPGADPAG